MWTPELQEQTDLEIRQETHLVWALFEAIQQRGGTDVSVSMLGADFKVKQMKELNQFKALKLQDIFKQYDKVFQFKDMEETKLGSLVSIQPDGEASLPEPDEELSAVINANAEADLLLPSRIESPAGVQEKMQALRIELLYALSRRDNKASCTELGQDPRLQKCREGIAQAKQLQNFIKLFPANFGFVTEDEIPQVSVLDYDVTDQSMIESSVASNQRAWDANQARWGGGYNAQGQGKTIPGFNRPWDPNHKPTVVAARFPQGTGGLA